jgi:hypothetical protein
VPTELKIKWQGVAPGVPEGRLSLGAFSEPLTILLASLRRIATNLVGDAVEGKNIGRFANAARQLDIEITDLVRESSGFDSVITLTPSVGENLPLFQELTQQAGFQLLDSIDSERRGVLRNASVRNYLRALPQGISHQTYTLHDNGTVLKQVSFGSVELSEVPGDLPCVVHYIGNVIGVGFEPGRPEVRIKTDAATTVTLAATQKQVDVALGLRFDKIRAVAVDQGGSRRLLILQEVNRPINRSTRDAAIFDRWEGVLRRLAQ